MNNVIMTVTAILNFGELKKTVSGTKTGVTSQSLSYVWPGKLWQFILDHIKIRQTVTQLLIKLLVQLLYTKILYMYIIIYLSTGLNIPLYLEERGLVAWLHALQMTLPCTCTVTRAIACCPIIFHLQLCTFIIHEFRWNQLIPSVICGISLRGNANNVRTLRIWKIQLCSFFSC